MTQDDRYTPVNLTRNTIEFRIFKGTLKWETVLASIEFCEAVISYCTQYGASRLNDRDFTAWLKSAVTRKTYPALRDYLTTRTILPTRRQKPADKVTEVTVSEPAPEPEVVAPVCPYGTVEPAIERTGADEWVAAEYNSHFFEDGRAWFVTAEAIDRRGWLGAVPVLQKNSFSEIITIPLVAGQTWFSPDRCTSLTIIH
jgi:hypothetical protein